MLTQSEADALISMEKKRTNTDIVWFPEAGDILSLSLASLDDREVFLLDVNRGRIKLSKCTYQERYRQVEILVRLDVDGPPHTNPDVLTVPLPHLVPYNGAEIPCPHLHLYVEGFMDRWAVPASLELFPNTNDLYITLDDFFRYCNVVEPPPVQRKLFL